MTLAAVGAETELMVEPIVRASGVVRLPGSKSISIRALLLSAFASGQTTLSNLLESEDTRVMVDALKTLGVGIVDMPGGVVVTGSSELALSGQLFMGNSGLSIRTLLPVLASLGGSYRLSGVERMHQRPIGDLVDALRSIGADITYLQEDGFPPLHIGSARLEASRGLAVAGNASSQFLSGLLQAAPIWRAAYAIDVVVTGQLISAPYVALTIDLMRRFGVAVDADLTRPAPLLRIPAGACYVSPGHYRIEGDASSASYFLALGALTGGRVLVEGVSEESVQPDIRFIEALRHMGAGISTTADGIAATSAGVGHGFRFRAINADMNHMPDAAMTLAVVCMFADGPCRLTNIGSWRVKESDRIAAMAAELRKFGATVDEGADWIGITPPRELRGAQVETYDDHRIAMSMSLMACGGVPVSVRNPACVKKTFPDYFAQLRSLTR